MVQTRVFPSRHRKIHADGKHARRSVLLHGHAVEQRQSPRGGRNLRQPRLHWYGHFVGGALQCYYWDFCAYRKHVCSTLLTQGDMADERSSAGNGWRNLDWGHGYGGTVSTSYPEVLTHRGQA